MQTLVQQEILSLIPAGETGGMSIAVRIDGQMLLYTSGPQITSDTQFNIASLRKPFEATLLAEAVSERKMSLDDPVSKYVPELAKGRDIRRVTLGQLAAHRSGLLLPHDHPPWPTTRYTLESFLETLNAWEAEAGYQPGQRHRYTHAGYVLLQLALERGLGAPIRKLLQDVIFTPVGMRASLIPQRGGAPPHAVQGYDEEGEPVGVPGDQQTYYDFPATGQMYATAPDLARFLAANMGEPSVPPTLSRAMQLAQTPVVRIDAHNTQAFAWEIDDSAAPPLVDKNGGLNNASAYMGMAPSRRVAIVVLCNRGGVDVAEAGRRVLRQLAQQRS